MVKKKLIKINKKFKKTLSINQKAAVHILNFLSRRYSEYAVEVEQNNGEVEFFDDLQNALLSADRNQDYVKGITITAQKATENFCLRFVNPDERRGATVLMEGTSFESINVENMDTFFYDLKEIFKSKRLSYRSFLYTAIAVAANIYFMINGELRDSLPYASFLISMGVPLFAYLMDLLVTAVSHEHNRVLVHIDEETVKYYNEENKEKKRIHGLISFVIFAISMAAMYFIWRMKV